MTATLQSPSPSLTPPPTLPPAPPRRRGRGILIGLGLVLAALMIASSAGAWAIRTFFDDLRTSSVSIPIGSVDRLEIDLGEGSLEIAFVETDQAELTVRSVTGADNWELEQRGDALRVAAPTGWHRVFGDAGDASLLLPASMQGVDITAEVAAGALDVDGDFGIVTLSQTAGSIRLAGAATELDLELTAGDADLRLTDVQRAEAEITSGRLTLDLPGTRPEAIRVSLTAGEAELFVPEGDFAVTSEVLAGTFENRIGSDPGAASMVHVELTAGTVTLDRHR